MHLGVLEHVVHGVGDRPPAGLFHAELASPLGRHFISGHQPVANSASDTSQLSNRICPPYPDKGGVRPTLSLSRPLAATRRSHCDLRTALSCSRAEWWSSFVHRETSGERRRAQRRSPSLPCSEGSGPTTSPSAGRTAPTSSTARWAAECRSGANTTLRSNSGPSSQSRS